MSIFSNTMDPSGMYSKLGKFSFQRYTVFKDKDVILSNKNPKSVRVPYIDVLGQLEAKFGKNKDNNEDIEVMKKRVKVPLPTDKSSIQLRDRGLLRQGKKLGPEPFQVMLPRKWKKKPEIWPEMGVYHPKYSLVSRRVVQIPSFNHALVRSNTRSPKKNKRDTSLDQLDLLLDQHNKSYEASINHSIEARSKYSKAFYSFDKMIGRDSNKHLMRPAPDNEISYSTPAQNLISDKGKGIISFDKYTGRSKKLIRKRDNSSPAYYPKYNLVERRSALGVPVFVRTPTKRVRKNISPDREFSYQDPVSFEEKKIISPNFKRMKGRKDLYEISFR